MDNCLIILITSMRRECGHFREPPPNGVAATQPTQRELCRDSVVRPYLDSTVASLLHRAGIAGGQDFPCVAVRLHKVEPLSTH
jgi:hypothetical protein